jgi:hypothetical protein
VEPRRRFLMGAETGELLPPIGGVGAAGIDGMGGDFLPFPATGLAAGHWLVEAERLQKLNKPLHLEPPEPFSMPTLYL